MTPETPELSLPEKTFLARLRAKAESRGRPFGPRRSDRPRVRRIVSDITPPPSSVARLREIIPPRPSSRLTDQLGRKPRPPEDKEPILQPPAALPPRPEAASEPPLPRRAESGPELTVRTWEPEKIRRSRQRSQLVLALTALVIATGAIIPTFILPTFAITIYPKIETTLPIELELTANTDLTDVDVQNRRIPALAITADLTMADTFAASGRKFVQERARGTVLVFNAYSSAPQTLVAQTRLQDPSGKIFRLTGPITVPGAKVEEGRIIPTAISASVVAEAPGEAYNIGPSEFRIPGLRASPKYQGFMARSEAPFQGGFSGEASIVLAADLQAASENVTRRAVAELQSELERKVPSDHDFLLPDGSREIAITRIDQPKPGERYERFEVKVAASGRIIAVRKSQLAQILVTLALPQDSTLPSRLTQGQPNLKLGAKKGQRPSELRLTAAGTLTFWRETDTADLKQTLLTSTPRKAEAYLRGRAEISAFRTRRFPRWLWYIPGRSGGLSIRIEPPA